jgi:mRNA-degrading endonuclease RelE of RelBE toxin-antitoxin system
MPPKIAGAVRDALEAIAAKPFARHANVKPLTGVDDGFRYRRGDWRAVYWLDRGADEMVVSWIGPRGDAYR